MSGDLRPLLGVPTKDLPVLRRFSLRGRKVLRVCRWVYSTSCETLQFPLSLSISRCYNYFFTFARSIRRLIKIFLRCNLHWLQNISAYAIVFLWSVFFSSNFTFRFRGISFLINRTKALLNHTNFVLSNYCYINYYYQIKFVDIIFFFSFVVSEEKLRLYPLCSSDC